MPVQKKSLISNRVATQKAIIASKPTNGSLVTASPVPGLQTAKLTTAKLTTAKLHTTKKLTTAKLHTTKKA